ncbi:MAG TPA: septum formation family protein [Nocardioidaceae bacterium]
MLLRYAAPAAALLLVLTGCTTEEDGANGEPGAGPLDAPSLGACRELTPEDVAQAHNASPVVDCSESHTAETFAVGSFRGRLAALEDPNSPKLGRFIYEKCSSKFQSFLGGDESLVMRSLLTWAWFRPTEEQWEQGARWYRCDVVSGNEESEELRTLPRTAKGLLLGRPDDDWMTCAVGETVTGSQKVACSDPHDWRAVTTIQVGREGDPYPGDRVVEVRTRDFCSGSVGAWMNYPVDYEFGYTFFRSAEWKAGNRRSICWARTDE